MIFKNMCSKSLILTLMSVVTAVKGNILHTAQGVLRGVKSEDSSYISYNGIPYAGDPSKHRFRRAPPAQAWQGVREAEHERVACASAAAGAVVGDEDCLFLNVHVPTAYTTASVAPADRLRGSLRPVLVWLHGGGFSSGSASPYVYDPQHFARRGIVIVAVSYRLGPLGFLCLGSERAPGNAGVKDALLALRWVRDNIIAFGGDASRVTLAGDGSGAAMTEALVLSSTSEGLIERAILQSGTALAAWAYNYDAQERAEALAKYFTDRSDVKEMAASAVNAKVEQLVLKSRRLDFAYFPFAMCTEKEFKKEERLLSAPPVETLTANRFKRIPMLIGYNSEEAYILAPMLVRARVARKARRDLSLLLPEVLQFVSENERQQVTERIRKAYFQESNFTMTNLLEYYSDAHFTSHIVRSAKSHASASDLPVYMYEFSHAGRLGVPAIDGVEKRGPAHSDELAYLFGRNVDVDEHDRGVQDILVTLWANFVKNGNPTPEVSNLLPATWDPLKGSEPRVYSIGAEVGMRRVRSDQRLRMWEDIYDKYYYRRVRSS